MKDRDTKKLLEIAGRFYTEEEIHGFPHIRRMLKSFGRLKLENDCFWDDTMDAIKASIILHDVGIAIGRENHASNSAVIIRGLVEAGELKFVPNTDWVISAVRRHNEGPKIFSEKPNSEWACISMLIFFDHLDGIGEIGAFRAVRFYAEKNIYPLKRKEGFRDILNQCITKPGEVDLETKEAYEFKRSCLLGGLAYNYAISDKIWKRVSLFIGDTSIEAEYLDRMDSSRRFLVNLWRQADEAKI